MAATAISMQSSGTRVRFDGFELDEANAWLAFDGRSVAIAPRPFAVLCALARRPGCLVTKDHLLDMVWGHRFVTDSVLKTAISDVRAALGDDSRRPRYIETVPRRGYRFIDSPGGSGSAPSPSEDERPEDEHPTVAALRALCAGDAALADLIRALADALERERPLSARPDSRCRTASRRWERSRQPERFIACSKGAGTS